MNYFDIMGWVNVFFTKLKVIIVKLIDIFRYILCSKRSRRKLSADFVPLSSIGIVTDDKFLKISTDDDIPTPIIASDVSHPRNVQDHINYYRQQKCLQMTAEPVDEIQQDFFQDMKPNITRQQTVLVKQKEQDANPPSMSNRLSFASASTALKDELACWEDMENTGSWEIDEINTKQLIREQRSLEREKRMAENMKKRMDKDKVRFSSKIS